MTPRTPSGARPPRIGRPAGLEPDHRPRGRARRRLVADHARRRALPRLHLRDRRHQHRPRPSARGGRDRRAGRQDHPRPAEHPLPRARAAAATSGSRTSCPADRGRPSCRTRGPRRSRPSVKLARVRHRPAGDHRLPRRLPRPHRPDDGAHDGQGRLPRPLRAAARLRLPHAVSVLLPSRRRRPRARRLHVRLGGASST